VEKKPATGIVETGTSPSSTSAQVEMTNVPMDGRPNPSAAFGVSGSGLPHKPAMQVRAQQYPLQQYPLPPPPPQIPDVEEYEEEGAQQINSKWTDGADTFAASYESTSADLYATNTGDFGANANWPTAGMNYGGTTKGNTANGNVANQPSGLYHSAYAQNVYARNYPFAAQMSGAYYGGK